MYESTSNRDTLFRMGKKRLVMDLTQAEHDELVRDARRLGLTVSNYVRKTLNIPLRQQGVKHLEDRPKTKQKPVGSGKKSPTA
jgi:hypothetical protein